MIYIFMILNFSLEWPLNCMQHDIRTFIKYGLKVDGTGDHTSVAGAPNHIETLMIILGR